MPGRAIDAVRSAESSDKQSGSQGFLLCDLKDLDFLNFEVVRSSEEDPTTNSGVVDVRLAKAAYTVRILVAVMRYK